MQVVMLATMADFGTLNRARSSLRSSADNFLKNKQWSSWYRIIPFGYEEDGEWIQRKSEMEPLINDLFQAFLDTENYTKTASQINRQYQKELANYDRLDDDSLNSDQIKSIVTRPVYKGEPTIPITDLEHYESYPSVDDPSLQFIDDKIFDQAAKTVDRIAKKYSTDDNLTTDAEEYVDEFSPYIIESVSPPVRLICPKCTADLIADGHQRQLDGNCGSRMYKCSNDECGHQRRWPQESELDMMEILANFDDYHSIL
jgi:hypothetical protein